MGKSGAAAMAEKGANAGMIEQTEYDRLRRSVTQEKGGPGQQGAATKKKKPKKKQQQQQQQQQQRAEVENDLAFEDVDDFLGSLM